MASYTLMDVTDVFPVGTSVEAYAAANWRTAGLPPAGAPQGSATATATVDAGGEVAFTGLTAGEGYYAAAQMGGTWRYMGFTAPDDTTPMGLDARVDAAEASLQAVETSNLGKADALVPTAVKTANYTAAANDYVPVDTTAGAVTITLPAAPADKTRIGVKHVIQGGTNAVTIARGGSSGVFNKAGGSTSLSLPLLNQSFVLQYKSSTGIWYAQSGDTPLSQLDVRYPQLSVANTFSQPQALVTMLLGASQIQFSQEPNGAVDAIELGADTPVFLPHDIHLTTGDQTVDGYARRLTINPGSSIGTDIAGAGLTLAGGRGTGNQWGGGIAFQTTTAGVSGTTPGDYVTRWSIESNGGTLVPGGDNLYNFGSSIARIGTVWTINVKSGSATGADVAGTTLTLSGGSSTGSASGGQILFVTTPPGSVGSTLNSGVARWAIAASGPLLPAVDNAVDIGSTTFRVGSIHLSNTVRIGVAASLPTAGAIRLANSSQVMWRNAANSADLRGIEVTTGNETWIAAGIVKADQTNSKLAFFNQTAVVRPSAITQTYSTATRTHAAITSAAVATTAATTTAPFGYTTQAQADAIVAAINANQVDIANVKQVLNAVIDDLQALGLEQ